MKWPGVNVCPTRHANWSHVHHQGCTVFAWSITSGIIGHIIKALVPLPCFLFSHTPQTFFLPNNKLSHPFFITQVFQHWSSLKVREAFLWPEGHYSLNLPDLLWKRGWGSWMSTSQPPSKCPWATHRAFRRLCCSCSGQFVTLYHI